MKPIFLLTVALIAVFALLAPGIESARLKNCPAVEEEDEVLTLPEELESSPGEYEWVVKTPGTIPYKCMFVYGGGYNRLLYVGRVRVEGDVLPAAIHHYGRNTTESVHYLDSDQVQVQVKRNVSVEWLCSSGRVAWLRVANLSDSTLAASGAIPIGYDRVNDQLLYGCIVHSFFSDEYPASLGTVVDGECIFEVNGEVLNSGDFDFWHTLELLVTL